MPDRHDTPSDEELLDAFIKGDDGALGLLAERFEPRLLGLCRGLCGNDHSLAGEAMQETWMRVIRYADRFDRRSTFATWVYRIAVNRCRDINRRERRQRTKIESLANSSESRGLPPDSDLADQLAAPLASLTERDREVVLLCHHRGMTHEQAAAVLAMPVGTLKTRLYRSMRALHAALTTGVSP
ncbi:MAG: RNA polymerase sigma factor [Phycisphaerales bacterium]|nr:RNA polymerase sigma factor [Phycisphaerales bacterium]